MFASASAFSSGDVGPAPAGSNVPLARRFAPPLTGGGVNRKRPVPAEPPPDSLSWDSFPSLSLAVASHSLTALPPASCISLSQSPGDLMSAGMFAAAAAILSSTVRLRLSSDSEDTDGASRGGDHIAGNLRSSPFDDVEAASPDPLTSPSPGSTDVFRDLKTSHSGSGFTSGSTGPLGFPAMFHTVGSSFGAPSSPALVSESGESCVLDRRMPLAARVTPVRTRLSSAPSSAPMRGRSSFGARRASSVMDGTEGMREARASSALVPTPMLPSRRCTAARAFVTRESIAARSSPSEKAPPLAPSPAPEVPAEGSEPAGDAIPGSRDLRRYAPLGKN